MAGEISFGFYMLHQMMIGMAPAIFKRIIPYQISEAGRFLLVFMLVFALSILSFYFFEKPMNQWVKKALNNRRHKTKKSI
jgi:peptidoglycan/LPS O-acetylase OafA/YrhL